MTLFDHTLAGLCTILPLCCHPWGITHARSLTGRNRRFFGFPGFFLSDGLPACLPVCLPQPCQLIVAGSPALIDLLLDFSCNLMAFRIRRTLQSDVNQVLNTRLIQIQLFKILADLTRLIRAYNLSTTAHHATGQERCNRRVHRLFQQAPIRSLFRLLPALAVHHQLLHLLIVAGFFPQDRRLQQCGTDEAHLLFRHFDGTGLQDPLNDLPEVFGASRCRLEEVVQRYFLRQHFQTAVQNTHGHRLHRIRALPGCLTDRLAEAARRGQAEGDCFISTAGKDPG